MNKKVLMEIMQDKKTISQDNAGKECANLIDSNRNEESSKLLVSLGYPQDQISMRQSGLSQATAYPFDDIVDSSYFRAQSANKIKILNVGCGLGFDDFLINRLLKGHVIHHGIDTSKSTVDCQNNLTRSIFKMDNAFATLMDVQKMNIDSAQDFVQTNGSMCLLDDKEKAFGNIQKAMKPEGKFTFIITVLFKDLSEDQSQPSIIKKFSKLDFIKSGLEKAGFENLVYTNIGKKYNSEPGQLNMRNLKTGNEDTINISDQIGFLKISGNKPENSHKEAKNVRSGFTCDMCKKLLPQVSSHECTDKCSSFWSWLQGSCEGICEELCKYSPSTACWTAGYC